MRLAKTAWRIERPHGHTATHATRPHTAACCTRGCRAKTARKRLAVPFRAADTPSDRSEYKQPDVAVVLTHLAYYRDGLTVAELKAALEVGGLCCLLQTTQ